MAAFRTSALGLARASALVALAVLGVLGVSLVLLLPGARAFLRGFPGHSDDPAAGTPSGAETGLSLPALLGDSGAAPDAAGASGFPKVTGPRPFVFPGDHGPHPEFRNEWWYFTGNLQDKEGRKFGYQLTFFRSALHPPGTDTADNGRTSPWATRHAYMAHFAVTDAGAGAFEAHERFSRAALGLAGAEAGSGKPFRVWLEDWSAAGDTGFLPLRLRASQGSIAIDLHLGSGKPMVLQGDRGYSRKGPEPGNASLYYSYTRLPTSGTIKSPAGEFTVSGTSWMDREWGSSLLSPGLAGWEWFALRLADSTDWVFFRLRKAGREAAAEDSVIFDYGLKVNAKGETRLLGRSDLSARILSRWTGPNGVAYPAGWRLRIPSESLELEVSPLIAGQALMLSIPYWEGAVRVGARKNGGVMEGEGYMELTGY